jgi:hypothetical protein
LRATAANRSLSQRSVCTNQTSSSSIARFSINSQRIGFTIGTGPLPFVYDMKDGNITVVEPEAEQVRLIHRRYLEIDFSRPDQVESFPVPSHE